MEAWKDIAGYEGLYQVSNKGRVRGLDRVNSAGANIKGRSLSLNQKPDGYIQVNLFKDGKRKTYTVHRLVAEAFIPNPNNKPCVGHLDESRDNNQADNLYWCTHYENNNYGSHNQKVIEKQINNPKRMRPLIATELKTKKKVFFNSFKQAEKQGFNRGSISRCIRGIQPSHKGYEWQQLEKGKAFNYG